MKTYKTWEAIKMLTENSSLEFEDVNTNARILKRDVEYPSIVTIEHTEPFTGDFPIDGEWILKQQPVSFIEAVKSGKKIRVEYSNVNIDYDTLDNILIRLGKDYLKRDIVKILTNGKWYIKEDEEETTFTDKTKFIEINYKDLRDQERRTKYFATQEEYEKWHEENWNDVVING